MPSPSDSDRTRPIAPRQQISSLVLGGEDSFRAHVLGAIADLGPVAFARMEAGDPADIVALVLHERPDVVLLDATGREGGVRRVVLDLVAAPLRVGVVVVCEDATAAARALGALPKWGWTQDLRSAVQDAFLEGGARTPSPAGPLAGWAEEGPPRGR